MTNEQLLQRKELLLQTMEKQKGESVVVIVNDYQFDGVSRRVNKNNIEGLKKLKQIGGNDYIKLHELAKNTDKIVLFLKEDKLEPITELYVCSLIAAYKEKISVVLKQSAFNTLPRKTLNHAVKKYIAM